MGLNFSFFFCLSSVDQNNTSGFYYSILIFKIFNAWDAMSENNHHYM